MASIVSSLESKGVSVHTYPLQPSLVSPQTTLAGAFGFTITGPPGSYRVQVTLDALHWLDLAPATNTLGAVEFIDPSAAQRPQGFYRVIQLQ